MQKHFFGKSEICFYMYIVYYIYKGNDACCALWPHMEGLVFFFFTNRTELSYSTLRVVARETEPQTLGSSQQDDQARPPNDVKSSNLIEDFTFFCVCECLWSALFLDGCSQKPKTIFCQCCTFSMQEKIITPLGL